MLLTPTLILFRQTVHCRALRAFTALWRSCTRLRYPSPLSSLSSDGRADGLSRLRRKGLYTFFLNSVARATRTVLRADCSGKPCKQRTSRTSPSPCGVTREQSLHSTKFQCTGEVDACSMLFTRTTRTESCRPTSAFHALPLDCDHPKVWFMRTHAVTCVGPQGRIDGHASVTDAYRSRANGLPTPKPESGTKGIGSASERFGENDITDGRTEAGGKAVWRDRHPR